MKITIVGGGIGGMTLALSLFDAGLRDVDIYESATGVKELGVGINVLPHAVRELTELGLLDDLCAVGIPTADWILYSRHGQEIWRESRGVAAGYHWPQLSIHRGELLGLLYRAVCTQLGASRVHTDRHLVEFGRTEPGGLWCDFADRATGKPVLRVGSDLLVACDGVHSAVRKALYPSEGPPKWNGVTMWRGLTEGEPFLSGRTMIAAGFSGCTVIVYPISKRHEDGGRAWINWVVSARTAAGGRMPAQDWQHEVDREQVLAVAREVRLDFLDLPALIRGAEAVYQYPMVDRDPLPTWDFGNLTLLGDAAHPMYPTGANGASQAIIDARVLARELALRTGEAAIAAYDAQRRPATAAVVEANRRGGPMKPLALVEQRAPDGFAKLEDVISPQELTQIAEAYKREAGFDAEMLNNRPSLSVR
jgi:2-polyprenyl-6-methoxyphenol hydroxylase-like FAD-dependent oxidoreductase